MGALLLTEEKQNLSELFIPDLEVITYRDVDEIVSRVSEYLGDETAAARVAEAGQRRTLGEHSYLHRIESSSRFSSAMPPSAAGRVILLKAWVVSLARRLVAHAGFDLVKLDPEHAPELRRPFLLANRSIDVLVDVGANDGTFSRRARASGFSGRIIAFEPAAAPFAVLAGVAEADGLMEARKLALSSSSGEALLKIAANTSSSSLLEMEQRHAQAAPESIFVGQERVVSARLDDVLGPVIGDGSRLYLKIDVQGAELDVLVGAEETLRIAEVVDCELSLCRSTSAAEVDRGWWSTWAREGFGLLWIEPVLRDPTTNELLQLDGLFVRTLI